jgi:RND family efflux transporter MFP subunit
MLAGSWLGSPLVLVLGAMAIACAEEPQEAAPALRPVRYERVSVGPLSLERSLAAVVRAGVESRLSFRVAGSIRAVDVKVGDSVRRGQVLAWLDPTDFELQLEEAKAALAQAQASLRQVEADYGRVRSLYENNNSSKAELDASRANAESAEASVEAVTRQLDQAQQRLGYTTLRAPADGAIASVAVEANENVQSGQEVCLLLSGGESEVVVPVPSVMIGFVQPGQLLTVTIDALAGEVFEAEVTEVGVAVTGGATTFPVTARLLGASVMVRAGMAAEATFLLEGATGDRIFVPGVAVGEDRDGRYVFLLDPDGAGAGTVRRQSVEIGETNATGIEILSGLSADDLVVTAGARRLTDGMQVAVLEPAEAGG